MPKADRQLSSGKADRQESPTSGHSRVPDDGDRQPDQDRNDHKDSAVEPMLAKQQGLVRHLRRVHACFRGDSFGVARPSVMRRWSVRRKCSLKRTEHVTGRRPALRVGVVEPNAEASLNFFDRRYLVPVSAKAEATRRVIFSDCHARY
jgi:hypothetical protein